MGVPQKERALDTLTDDAADDVVLAPPSEHHRHPDEVLVLSTLKNLVAAGEHRLDPILAAIADAGVLLTGASGVALAMWKEGAMVCRARSGETAPALDAELSAEQGISGECLRTGKSQHCSDTEDDPLVDVEVCRMLGVRSIAVAPIQAKRRMNGILEIFAPTPAAFSEHHLAILEQLAGLAERAHALQPIATSAIVAPAIELKVQEVATEPEIEGALPVAFAAKLPRPLLLAAVGLVAVLLLSLAVWLGLRGRAANGRQAQTKSPSLIASVPIAPANVSAPGTASHISDSQDSRLWNDSAARMHSADNHLTAKPSQSAVSSDISGVSSGSGAKTNAKPVENAGQTARHAAAAQRTSVSKNSGTVREKEVASIAPPPIPGSANPAALAGILTADAPLPKLSPTLSRGVSGGQLLHRVPPVYPEQAKMFRLQGKVILDATVMEDGSVRDPKVVQGEPVLARSAVEAVKQWRYQPFVLDGKPVKTGTRITVDFRLPTETR